MLQRQEEDVDSMMIHAYRNESTMMITMMYDNVDDTIHVQAWMIEHCHSMVSTDTLAITPTDTTRNTMRGTLL